MKRSIFAIAFLAGAGGVISSDAKAQGFVITNPVMAPARSADVYPSGYVPPYSYWASRGPYPARNYVGLGPTGDFAYYGRPYGHAYDAWTWANLDAPPYYGGQLNRYYYPPLGW